MIINRETSIREIIEVLQQEHCFRYNTLDHSLPFMILRKDNGFGSYLMIHQGKGILASLKCSPDHESHIISKQLVTQALEELGYEVKE